MEPLEIVFWKISKPYNWDANRFGALLGSIVGNDAWIVFVCVFEDIKNKNTHSYVSGNIVNVIWGL